MKNITFNDLLTVPQYRAMSLEEIHNIIIDVDDFIQVEFEKGIQYFNIKDGNLSRPLYNHLQSLK